MSSKRIVSRIGTSENVPSLRQGEMGFDTDTKVFRVGDDTATPPGILTSKTEAFDLSNLKNLQLSAEVLDYLAKKGSDGWTPVLATETFHDRELLKVIDWVDGIGDKPYFPVYVSATGLVTDPNLATNIKGKKGSDASGPVISFSIDNGSLLMNVLNPDETQAPIGGYVDDDGYLIIEYEAINGTTIHTSLGKVIIRFRGAYNPITTYHPLDEVTENNKLYRVKYDSEPVQGVYVNNINHWSLILDYDLNIESDVWTAQVDTLLDRATYDNYEPGTTVIVNNVGDDKAAVYTRIGIAGNWTAPAYLTGPAGLIWQDGGWLTDTFYQRNLALYHDGTSYRALVGHVSTAETEPGVGVDWETVWQALALGSNVDEVDIVAGIAADVTAVANIGTQVSSVATIDDDVTTVAGVAGAVQVVAPISNEVQAVAAIHTQVAIVANQDADVATVAANIADVTTAAQNIADIQAAPQAASDARAWAEGTEPDGPGTKSAKEYALEAADSASTAASATLIEYGVNIYDPDGVPSGGWHSKRYSPYANKQEVIFAEIEGDPGSEISFVMLAGGVPVYGPITVTEGAPVILTGLDIPVGTGEGVAYMTTVSAGVHRVNIESNGKLL